jgi:nitrilase
MGMSQTADSFKIAAVQAAPVFLEREATVDKACNLIEQVGRAGARLAVFPECFIPAYPVWCWFIPPAETHALRELYAELHENAVAVPGRTTECIGEAAAAAGVAVVIGVNERNAEASDGTLFNTLLFFGPDGTLLGKHRKLMPTGGERLVHGIGYGDSLRVHDMGVARVSGLICWENYMPLARQALWAQGPQIHAAPTWDRGEPWLSTLRHTGKESRCWVVGCCTALHRDDIPDRLEFKKRLPEAMEWVNPGLSQIVDPDGKVVAGPAEGEETVLYAEVDPRTLSGPRFQIDVAGHYARPDVFQLTVNRDARPMLTEVDREDTF